MEEVIVLAALLALVTACLIYVLIVLLRVSRAVPGIVSKSATCCRCSCPGFCGRSRSVAPSKADGQGGPRKTVVLATVAVTGGDNNSSKKEVDAKKRRPSTASKPLDGNAEYDWEIDPKKLKLKYMIGKGNFGEVWLATWATQPVAVKTVLPELQSKEKLVKRFIDEILLMSQLHHPNVVLFRGACLRRPHLCIVMEFCVHGSLHHFLKAEAQHGVRVTMPLIYRFALDIARGVGYLHRRCNVVQRDLKARNILVDQSLNAKVSDFGLSRVIDDQVSAKLTACGTPAWTAPEIVKMERYTDKVDVYSFGIILWEILTRQEPYGGQKGVQIAYAAAEQGLRPIIPAYCPPEYGELMSQCWASNPDARPTFQEILTRLFALKKAADAEEASKIGEALPFGRADTDDDVFDEEAPSIAATPARVARVRQGPIVAIGNSQADNGSPANTEARSFSVDVTASSPIVQGGSRPSNIHVRGGASQTGGTTPSPNAVAGAANLSRVDESMHGSDEVDDAAASAMAFSSHSAARTEADAINAAAARHPQAVLDAEDAGSVILFTSQGLGDH